jgi:hypothetical protein
MSFRFSRLVSVLALSAAVAGVAEAQGGSLHLGPRVSYQFDLEEAAIGAQFGAPIARNLEFYPSFDYYFVEPGSFWNLNADLKYRMPAESAGWLYLGAGLNIARRSVNENSSTDTGLNAFLGVESRSGRVHPFAEFRFTANDNSSAQISLGLNFTLRN